jgi:hypothetical protein
MKLTNYSDFICIENSFRTILYVLFFVTNKGFPVFLQLLKTASYHSGTFY